MNASLGNIYRLDVSTCKVVVHCATPQPFVKVLYTAVEEILCFCRKDEGWHLSRGVYIFLGFGLFLLLGAIAAVIATISPWMVSFLCEIKSYSFWISEINSEILVV